MTIGRAQDIAIAKRMENYTLTRGARTLLGICSGLTADGTLNDTEARPMMTCTKHLRRVRFTGNVDEYANA
jgi:hypothetical protein